LRIEQPESRFVCIDTNDLALDVNMDAVVGQIIFELQSNDDNFEVAYRNGERFLPKMNLHQSILARKAGRGRENATQQFGGVDGSAVVTGGLGGLGLVTAEALIEAGLQHIVLVSRTGNLKYSDQGLEVRLEKLRSSGAVVDVERCDMGVESEVEAMLSRVRAKHGQYELWCMLQVYYRMRF
jgi:hypothetical protein